VKEGRDAATLLEFLDALSQECAGGIEAVAIDMGPAYIAAVQKGLPEAAIVFECFHVMRMFSKVVRDCRRAEFKAARTLGDLTGQQAIKGSLWLLLSNRNTLKESDQARLDQSLAQNQPLATLYALKEQLLRLWHQPVSATDMAARLDDWCGMARAAKITGLAKFIKTLQAHRLGIFAYAEHPSRPRGWRPAMSPSACCVAEPVASAIPHTSSSRSTNSTRQINRRSSTPRPRPQLQILGWLPYESDEEPFFRYSARPRKPPRRQSLSAIQASTRSQDLIQSLGEILTSHALPAPWRVSCSEHG
jgi:hypothetical protein